MAAVISTAGLLFMQGQAKADLTWINGSIPANWDTTTPNWTHGAGTITWDGSTAFFNGSAGQPIQRINVVSPTNGSSPAVNAAGITFNTALSSSGYLLTSSTAGSIVNGASLPGNTLFLTNSNGSTPIISANYNGTVANTVSGALSITPAFLSQISDGIGAYQTQGPLLPLPQPPQTPDNIALGGSQGLVINGNGALVLDNPVVLTGGITVSSGATLVVGSFPIPANGSTPASTVVPTPILNNNTVTLNSATMYTNTQNSIFSTANPNQFISNLIINGNSTALLARGNAYASSSIKYNQVTVNPGATFTIQQAGNTNSTGSIMQFGGTTIPGSPASPAVTFNAAQWSVQLTSANTSSNATYVYTSPVPTGYGAGGFINYSNITGAINSTQSFGENFILGTFHDNGNAVNFQSGGSNVAAGTITQIDSSAGASTGASGVWNLGTPLSTVSVNGSNVAYSNGTAVELFTTSSGTGGITSNTINVNPYSQLFLDGSGLLSWGVAGQNINISGPGLITQADSTSTTRSLSDTHSAGNTLGASAASIGALLFSSDTNANAVNPLQNELLANVKMTASAVIDVANSTGSISQATAAQIDGNLTSATTGFTLTKAGPGILYLNGTANSWDGGTTINNGSIVVSANSSLGTAVTPTGNTGNFGPLTLASFGTTSATVTSTNLTLNANQTIGSLSSSFASSTGTASNTITLNSGNLNIIQTTAGTFGPGAAPATLTSSISGAGSISLDARSTASLTLGGDSTYTGGTNVSAGSLLVTNTFGSATGTGPVLISNANFGGTGIVTGAVTMVSSNLSEGATVGTGHLPGLLTLSGGLSLSGGSAAFYLNTAGSSDEISLGNSPLVLSGTSPTTINVFNLGALSTGSYPLFTYSDAAAPNVATGLITPPALGNFTFSLSSSTSEIDLVVSGPTPLIWAASAGSGTWDAGTSANWNNGSPSLVTFSNTGSAVKFDESSAGSASTITLSGSLTPTQVTFANTSKSYTLSGAGAINGSTAVIVAGTGTVTLATTGGNNFTGIVAVDGGGTLIASGDNQLGNPANQISLTSSASFTQPSTLEFSATGSTARLITVFGTGGGINTPPGVTTTLSGQILGGGGLTKFGSGTLVLSGTANAYSGATNISTGTFQLGASGATPGFTALIVGPGGNLSVGAFNNSVGSITGAGTITFNTSGSVLTAGFDNSNTTFTGAINGPGTLMKTGVGTLTLSGTASNLSGGLIDSGSGTIIGSIANTDSKSVDTGGSLGTGPVTINGGSTLSLVSTTNVFGPAANGNVSNFTLNTATGGGVLVAPSGSTITLPALFGNAALQISGGTTVTSSGYTGTFNVSNAGAAVGTGNLNTATGIVTPGTFIKGATAAIVGSSNITIGNNIDGGDTLIVNAVQGNAVFPAKLSAANISATSGWSNGDLGSGTGNVTVNSGSTYWLKGVQDGVAVTTNTSSGVTSTSLAGSGNGTLTLNNGATLEATGNTVYSAGSLTVANGAVVTLNVPGAGDEFLNNSAWRSTVVGDTAAVVNVTGNGLIVFASGAITTTTYNGVWNVSMGSTGILAAAPIVGGGGETLNAFGYSGTSSGGAGNPVNMSGGTLAFGADSTNSTDTTNIGANSFRSPLTFVGSSSLASTGFEYNTGFASNNATGYFTTTKVTANVAGNIVITSGVTLTVDTFDPVATASDGAYSLNFETDGSSVPGNFTWGTNATMVINPSTTTGGSVNFGRTSGQVFVLGTGSSGATLNILHGSNVNIGMIPGRTGQTIGGVPIGSGIDPLYDTTTGNAVAVVDGGSIVWAGRTSLDSTQGIKVYNAATLNISSGATATLAAAYTQSSRTALNLAGLSLTGTGKLDLVSNDAIVQNGNLTQLTNLVTSGFNGGKWNGGSGIVSSAAAADASHLSAIGVILNDDGTGTGNALYGSFDGANEGTSLLNSGNGNNPDLDVLLKYTYYGDTNLSGSVDGSDYSRIDSAYLMEQTTLQNVSGWFNGDFNYDGVVNGSDYTLMDNAFNSQGASLASEIGGPTAIATAQVGSAAASSVPEPTSIGLIAISAIGLLGRRRNRS